MPTPLSIFDLYGILYTITYFMYKRVRNFFMNSEKDLSVLRHSAAHLLAHAIKELFPSTILTIGPATKEGFFYDFLPEKNFKDEDLVRIEERMHEISRQNIPLTHKQISKDIAREMYKNNPFKLELINE